MNPKSELSEKDEAFWRNQFEAIDYKIDRANRTGFLQRELNSG